MHTIPLYLVALIVAIASTPLDIYQINAWNVGTLRVEPWRRQIAAPTIARARAAVTRFAVWCRTRFGDDRGEAAIDLVVPGATRLMALRQKAVEIHARIKELHGKASAAALDEKAPALTEGERTELTQLEARFTTVEQLRAEAERLNERERTFAIVPKDPDQEAGRRAAAGVSGATLEVGTSAEDKERKAPGFFGRALQSVRRIAVREAGDADHKMVKLLAGPTGLNTDVQSEGGFLVAPDRASGIVQRLYDQGAIASLVTRLPVSANSNGMNLPAIDETSRADNSRYGGIVSGWLGQGNTVTAGKPKIRNMELKLRKVGAFVYATEEMNTDAGMLEAWVNKYLPLELTFRAEDAFVNGDGSNKPIGILNSGAAVTVTRNTASRVLYEDVSAMWKRMWAPLRRTAVWLVDQSVEQDLEQLSISIGTAGTLAPIYKPAGIAVGPDGTQGYSPATLYGRPILTTEYNAALGTVGDIVLANFGEYTVIDKGGVNQMVSLHVAFLTDEAVYRFTYRVDGQCNWNAALTPKNGGATLSPVVTLT